MLEVPCAALCAGGPNRECDDGASRNLPGWRRLTTAGLRAPFSAADQKTSFRLIWMERGHCDVAVTFPNAEFVMVVLGALNMAWLKALMNSVRN